MKKNLLIIATLAAAISFASCDTKKTAESAANEATEAVENATEAAEEAVQKIEDFTQNLGTYEGTIAQADGAGFVTTLTFNPDMTYSYTEITDDMKMEENGTFSFDVASQKITLVNSKDESKKIFAVEGDKLVLCDAEGNLPENKDMYTLTHSQM